MAYTTINKSTEHFNTKLYSGNASTQAITGVGFQPDWCWFKGRNFTDNHVAIDAVRGTNKAVYPDTTGAETTQTHYFTSFDSDGYTLGNSGIMNGSSKTYASWNWKANGTGSANTDGDINSTVSVNTTAGFSIVKYTGNATANQSIGHGLGVRPKMIIVKNQDTAGAWMVWHDSLTSGSGTQKFLQLDNTNAQNNGSAGDFPYEPTTSVFKVGSYDTMNKSGDTIIAYCFAEVPGYSKFGSYTGNGNNDGAFVYTGFKPAWVMIKKTTGDGWQMFDNKRDPHNVAYHRIEADSNAGDYTGLSAGWVDMVSNGFKVRYSGGGVGSSGVSYVYMAFGQSLVGSNNVPCTAR